MTMKELILSTLKEANNNNKLVAGCTETCVLGILIKNFGDLYQQNDWIKYKAIPQNNFCNLSLKELLQIEDIFESNTEYKYFDVLQFGKIEDYFEEIQKENYKAIDLIEEYLKTLENVNTDIDCLV